jgi:hypothetical protein
MKRMPSLVCRLGFAFVARPPLERVVEAGGLRDLSAARRAGVRQTSPGLRLDSRIARLFPC